jgi:hypothetical protein
MSLKLTVRLSRGTRANGIRPHESCATAETMLEPSAYFEPEFLRATIRALFEVARSSVEESPNSAGPE